LYKTIKDARYKCYNKNIREIFNCITNTAFTYLWNLAVTNYKFPEDEAVASKHVGAV